MSLCNIKRVVKYRVKSIFEDLCMSNVLVVGASSFIGQHLVNKLIKKGENIRAFVRSMQKVPFDWEKVIKIYEGDITKKEAITGICKNIEVVFHLAAKVHDFSGITDTPREHFAINVEGTQNLLNSCIGSNVKHFVYFSSVKAMTEESKNTIDENFINNPTTPYGESKLAAESLVAEYGKKHGFRTTSLRLPLVYGPGNKGNIYKMIEAIDRGRFILIGGGENKRSMIYVGNVVDAALAVIKRQKADNEIYIAKDGIDYTVKEIYETIARGLGKKPLPFHIPMSIVCGLAWLGDIGGNIVRKQLPFNSGVLRKLTSSLTFSSHKIQENIGFVPRYNLYNTIDETISWYRNSKK